MISDYTMKRRLPDGDITHLSVGEYIPIDSNEARINEALKLRSELTGTIFVPSASTGTPIPVLVKRAQSPLYNELIEKERHALMEVAAWRAQGSNNDTPFVPTLIEHIDGPLQANVIPYFEGYVDLTVVNDAYPDGVDPQHVAWMWRRLLMALSDTTSVGLVHSAIMPEHILINPENRNLVLIDWCYSCEDGDYNAERVGRRIAWYPEESLDGDRVFAGTDIFMATKTMMWLMGDKAPKQMEAFAQACLQKQCVSRPSDPLALLNHLDELLERLYGKRKFRPFSLTPD